MEDYQGNSKKKRDPKALPKKEKEDKVVVGEVIVKKKPLGQKIKDMFIEADIKSVVRYVASDVLLPAARNLFVDASTKGIERLIYGDRAVQRRSYGAGPRTTFTSYNSPINRGEYRDPRTSPPSGNQNRIPRSARPDFLLSSKEEAHRVLERMGDIIDTYGVATVGDLLDLVGLPTTFVDQKWGWDSIRGVTPMQVREGWLLDFPPPEYVE